MNAVMRKRLPFARRKELSGRLVQLVNSPLVSAHGAWVLKPLLAPNQPPPVGADLIGWEALVNKIHVEDYLSPKTGMARLHQGALYEDLDEYTDGEMMAWDV